MRSLALCCLVALGGCFDFSRFDHVPDGAKGAVDLSLGDLSTIDVGVPDVAGADLAGDVLVNEPFDTLNRMLWNGSPAPATAFSIDTSQRIEGSGALRIDLTQTTASGAGQLLWTGTLPSSNGSRHLRWYERYDGVLDTNVDLGGMTASNGDHGDLVTLTPASSGSTSALVINNQYPDHFVSSGTFVQADDWHCYELGIDQIGTGAQWQTSLRIDDIPQPAATFVSNLASQVITLGVGMSVAEGSTTTVKTVWVDSVVLTSDSAIVGCPYPLP